MRAILLSVLLIAGAAVLQAAPAGGDANLPALPVGANDLIALNVYGAPEMSVTIRVDTEGQIRIPMVKQRIQVAGMQPEQIEGVIAKALIDEQIFVDPICTVTIAEYQSRRISVSGAVKVPLVFQADMPVTLVEALARAQGLTDDAGPEVLVSRSQPGPDGSSLLLTRRILVRGLIDNADPTLNLKLEGGEEVRVPEMGKIYVVGNVKRPGAFPVRDGSGTTVFQLLALAEGLAPYSGKEAYIYRQEAGGGKNEIVVPLDKIMQRKSPDVPLVANDILYITDNRRARLTAGALARILSFGTTAGSTALIYGTYR